MSNSIIRAAFESRLKTWADAQTPKIPIAFEGVPFTKPPSGPYLEPTLIPNVTVNNDLSGVRKTHLGLFEIKCWHSSGKGMGAVESLSNKIIGLFPLLPKTGSVSVENTPYAEHSILDEAGYICIPVLIYYRYESI